MSDTTKLSTPVTAFAVLILIVFGLFTWYLFEKADMPELLWTRHIFLYGGIEAIAFAAAGYLFGREVHRKQAESAEKRAEQKDKEATDAKTRGNRLAGAVIGRAQVNRAPDTGYGSLSAGEVKAREDLQDLQRMAVELFPINN